MSSDWSPGNGGIVSRIEKSIFDYLSRKCEKENGVQLAELHSVYMDLDISKLRDYLTSSNSTVSLYEQLA